MSVFLLSLAKGDFLNTKYVIRYTTSDKFNEDKIHFEDANYLVILDGVVLNKKQLFWGRELDWVQFLIAEYETKGEVFWSRLKGSFYGCLLDKNRRRWIVFSDHVGTKPIYYYENNQIFLFSNSYVALLEKVKDSGVSLSIDETAASLLLTYGYVFEDYTIAQEIKRLLVGYFATVDNNSLNLKPFFQLYNEPIIISEDDAIEGIDSRFRAAVSLAFEKDKEYGYRHLAALSGGLDSRMTVWVAHDLGYTDQLNITFSQSDYLDEKIAKRIASDLEHEWMFKSLDNGLYLKQVDEVTKITGGNVLYAGLAHGMSLYSEMNFASFGLLHSGQLGDVVVGSFSNKRVHSVYRFGDGAYSQKLIPSLKGFSFKGHYPNEELFKLYIRGFYGTNQGLLAANKYTETWSPFYDIDFMSFALSLPLELRRNHYIYKKWIRKKYQEAAKYIWEKEKVPVSYPFMIPLGHKHIALSQLPSKVLAKIGLNRYGNNTKRDMNPIGYWVRNNAQLKSFYSSYFEDRISLLNCFPILKRDCEDLFANGNGTEKAQVLTLLSSVDFLV